MGRAASNLLPLKHGESSLGVKPHVPVLQLAAASAPLVLISLLCCSLSLYLYDAGGEIRLTFPSSNLVRVEPGPDFGIEGRCQDVPSPPKLPPWMPPPGKFLLAQCHLYGWSNKLYCTERALVLAALLNRTLIVPSDDVCMGKSDVAALGLMYDVPHMRQCLVKGHKSSPRANTTAEGGSQAMGIHEQAAAVKEARETGVFVLSLPEYLALHKKEKLEVHLLLCENEGQWWSACPPKSCTSGDLVIHPNASTLPLPLFNSSRKMGVEQVQKLAAATAKVGVLSFGDTFYGVTKEFTVTETTPLSSMFDTQCNTLVQPAKEVFDLAAASKAEWLNGSAYAALHFRRGDFEGHCKGKGNCTFWSVQQSTECLATELKRAKLTKIFVATDAKSEEISGLARELRNHDIELFRFESRTNSSKFASMMAEKLICAQADLFIHQDKSTFSYSILQMRKGFETHSCSDKPLCAGRSSDFTPLHHKFLEEVLRIEAD